MRDLDTIVIGAGQAGLAMSWHLSALGLDHVVLERGGVGERWRTGSWDSLRLLTPNWMMRLPGFSGHGEDPDGFMTASAFSGRLQDYARTIDAPVLRNAGVRALEPRHDGYRAVTGRGVFEARTVVIATGACNLPAVPAFAAGLPAGILQIAPAGYRNPAGLPEGGVLVVGAASSGVQIADEIHRSGRPVTLAVGAHARLPRTYRGRDIAWWLDRIGMFDERYDAVPDIDAARRQPSLQLVGSPERRTLGLMELQTAGVRIVGRAIAANGPIVRLAGDLPRVAAAAGAKMNRILDRIDDHVAGNGLAGIVGRPDRPPSPALERAPEAIDLRAAGITTVVWATGYRRDYSWLRVPVLDTGGEIRHEGGIVPRPGLYVLGLRFLRRRKSSFIDGVGSDAAELSAHLAAYLRRPRRLAA